MFLFRVVDFSKFDGAIKLFGFRAWEGILSMVTCQGRLVKDGGIATNETPLVVFDNFAGVIFHWLTHMEDLLVDTL